MQVNRKESHKSCFQIRTIKTVYLQGSFNPLNTQPIIYPPPIENIPARSNQRVTRIHHSNKD
jgi:hypothetical protein